jgi:hypothetical protein
MLALGGRLSTDAGPLGTLQESRRESQIRGTAQTTLLRWINPSGRRALGVAAVGVSLHQGVVVEVELGRRRRLKSWGTPYSVH